MASLRWALLCQRVIVDATTNSVSYVDAVEQATVTELPFELPFVLVCSLWKRDEENEKLTFRYRILSPSGTVVKETDPDTLIIKRARQRINAGLGNIPLPGEGEYKFLLEHLVDDQFVVAATCYLEVELKKKQDDSKDGES